MRHLILILLLLLILLPLNSEEVRVGLPIVPGLLYRDVQGEPSGFYLDLTEALLEELKISPKWIDGNWSESLAAVQSGELDILPIAAITEERKKTLHFLETPVITTWSELYINERFNYKKITDLEGKEIGLVNNDNNSNAFTRYILDFGVDYSPVIYSDHETAMEELIRGKVFAVAGPADLDSQYGDPVVSSGLYFNAVNSTIAFYPGRNKELMESMDQLLHQWKGNPKSIYYQLLIEYSMVPLPVKNIIPRWVWYLNGVILLIILLAFTFIILLRHQVRSQTEKIEETQGQLEQSQKMEAVGKLAGGVAHDFNNMLTGIMGYAELLLPTLEKKQQIEYCRQILDSGLQAAELTDQLLSYARKNPVKKAELNLHEVIHGALKLLKTSLDGHIDVVVDLKAERTRILGDKTQLQNVFLNLGLNARDAMPRGGKIKIQTENQYLSEEYIKENKGTDWKPGRYILTRVIDTGIGMDEETLDKVYEPFFTTKDIGKGTGLGLSAVLGTVKSHHGGICLDSEPGKGTEFTIYLYLMDQD